MDFEDKKPKKKLTPNQATIKAQLSCAYQERCQQEMRDKLYEWGLYSNDVENIIANLISDNYLNEERFAKAYAGGKFRIKKWGRVKIKIELKRRKISDYCIKKAMQEIDENDYIKILKDVITKKLKEIPKGKQQIRNYKAAQYTISRGFEGDLVWEEIKQLESRQ
ncbi:MAG: RecX family transcriptional regulator [Bacteroidetes bacterium RIFCSPLOWO2_12_FULL_31_6]|nr:MAG: RecX family transcriptional regulator [Bacteroidetes bacterium RIFCSPLOWO2_12_FULL_31_6]